MARNFFSELSYAKPQSQFVGGINFENGLNKLDEIYSKVDDRPVGSTNSLRWDSDKAKMVDSGYEKEVDDLIASNTDPHQILGKVKQNARRRVSDLNNTNTLPGALNKSVSERSAAIKKYDDLSDKEFDKTYANLQLQKKDRQAEKSGGTRMSDDGLGFITYGEAPDIAAKIDVNEKYNKLGEGFKADEFGTEGSFRASSDGLYRIRNGKTTERVDEKDVLSVVGNGLARDNELVSSLRQDAEKDVFRTLLQRGVPRESALDALNEGKLPIGDSTIDVQALINKEVNSKINKAAQDAAVKFGYRRDKFTSDENKAAGADENAIANVIPQPTIDSQVYSNPAFAEKVDLPENNKDLSKSAFLKSQGVNYNVSSAGTGAKGFENYANEKDGKPLSKEKIDELNKQYEVINSGKNDKEKLEILSKNNPTLKSVFDATLKEKGDSKNLYKDVSARYNSKLQSLKTLKDIYSIPNTDQSKEMQTQLMGSSGEGLGAIVNMSVEENGKLIPYPTWIAEKNSGMFGSKDISKFSSSEIDEIRKNTKLVGNVTSLNDNGLFVLNYKGKSFKVTGSNEANAEIAPLKEAYQVVTKDLKQVGTKDNPIDFYSATHFPVKGIVKGKDIWDGNKHKARIAEVEITESRPDLEAMGLRVGDTVPLEIFQELANNKTVTKNFSSTKGVTLGGGTDGKYGKGISIHSK